MSQVEGLLRELAPQVLGSLARRYGQFDLCEDAVQEALLAAATQWPADGVPANPRGWLITVATRRLTDQFRSESARRRREDTVAAMAAPEELVAPGADADSPPDADDTLTLLFLCCHPAVRRPSQVALTLRAVGGLTTAEIARAFMVPEATMAPADQPGQEEHQGGRQPVRDAARGRAGRPAGRRAAGAVPDLQRGLHGELGPGTAAGRADRGGDPAGPDAAPALPDDGEVAGLLALMLLTDARRPRAHRRDGGWSRSPSRTARCGTASRSPRASR